MLVTVVAMAAVAAVVVTLSSGEDHASSAVDAAIGTEGTEAQGAGRQPSGVGAERPRAKVVKRGMIHAKQPVAQIPERLPEEDLWSMVPDRYGQKEVEEWDFEIQGGVDSPGTDPEGARLEVNDPQWSEHFEEELEDSFREMVMAHGVTIDRIACKRGRCLVELGYNGMEKALERVDSIRRWLTERVRCKAYTDGPFEGDSPHILPTQQIWILCGEPTKSPYTSSSP